MKTSQCATLICRKVNGIPLWCVLRLHGIQDLFQCLLLLFIALPATSLRNRLGSTGVTGLPPTPLPPTALPSILEDLAPPLVQMLPQRVLEHELPVTVFTLNVVLAAVRRSRHSGHFVCFAAGSWPKGLRWWASTALLLLTAKLLISGGKCIPCRPCLVTNSITFCYILPLHALWNIRVWKIRVSTQKEEKSKVHEYLILKNLRVLPVLIWKMKGQRHLK